MLRMRMRRCEAVDRLHGGREARASDSNALRADSARRLPWARGFLPNRVRGRFRAARRRAQKKRRHEAGVQLLRQVSYRQETYRAVPLYTRPVADVQAKSLKRLRCGYAAGKERASRRIVPEMRMQLLAGFAWRRPCGLASHWASAAAEPTHGIAMYGEPALPPDFVSLPYANPDAPKGGRIVQGEVGSFDSLNPHILKGNVPWQLRFLAYESLMGRNWDEPFTLYGLLAESVETDPRGAGSSSRFARRPDSPTARPSRSRTCSGPTRRSAPSATRATTPPGTRSRRPRPPARGPCASPSPNPTARCRF
jgi:hypothetical protein